LAPIGDALVAHLVELDGSSLVSVKSGLVAGSEGFPLRQGVRVITTASTKLIVAYLDGCEVKLNENQRYEVNIAKPCSERILDVKSILLPPATVGAALASPGFLSSAALSGGLQAGVGLGGLAGTASLVRERMSDTVSPN
jgi:hypothetical protein